MIIIDQSFLKYRTQKTVKIQDIYADNFQLVDPVSTTKLCKNEVLKTYKIDIYAQCLSLHIS